MNGTIIRMKDTNGQVRTSWRVVQAKSMAAISSAIISASVTGSVGATHNVQDASGHLYDYATVQKVVRSNGKWVDVKPYNYV